jgi:hypothetical protein
VILKKFFKFSGGIFCNPVRKYTIFTPNHFHGQNITNTKSPVYFPFSQFTVGRFNEVNNEFISAVSCSPKAYLKKSPANTTEVKAEMNIDDLKNPFNIVFLLFKNTASIIGSGTNIRIVKNVY